MSISKEDIETLREMTQKIVSLSELERAALSAAIPVLEGAEKLREAFEYFVSCAVTMRQNNTDEWCEYFQAEVDTACAVLGVKPVVVR